MRTVSETAPEPPRWAYRHRLPTRIWHWINAVTVFVMIGSGLMISNAHPHLYWGAYGANLDPAWLHLPRFPGWMTIPENYNLALARRWHLLFALVLAFNLMWFMVASLLNRHFARDLRLRTAELAPRHLLADVREHLAFRFHDAAHPERFNVLQKIAYASALFVLLPMLIATGLALSPGWNAGAPWLLDLFGGRQSARSLHFIAMAGLVVFVVVHLTLVILAGPVAEVRSMITGWFRPPAEETR
ncbi:cytochrome b/b6 domain-containing protein [Sphingomonas sp.]|jgi:Ni/Fe-hydrogenase b-type cytochrome subunit|uniref:cytochrome b/b6 domain-containing protein n=1 Tax=Sphingomonas sp. TaxID=28214 RepID=UPI002D802B13|nr:cytochrome b/b6 domain-containing protein [Sphingomonas sp.]HEU0043229.1 cytochrome b/b6 domain-containing protein [Sphingomonas sp.]